MLFSGEFLPVSDLNLFFGNVLSQIPYIPVDEFAKCLPQICQISEDRMDESIVVDDSLQIFCRCGHGFLRVVLTSLPQNNCFIDTTSCRSPWHC